MGVIAHNADWQYPAITEEHAFIRAVGALPQVEGIVYFGFPWATLIDLRWHGKGSSSLQESLKQLGAKLKPGIRVATVCQHIRLLDHVDLLAEVGITDIFWSHAVRGQSQVPGHGGMRIHPFPLYPVQAVNAEVFRTSSRPLLFSFLGAVWEEGYLTKSRQIIFEKLGSHTKGFVQGRENWHYSREVYGDQIKIDPSRVGDSVNHHAKELEFRSVLARSVFSLCPSGSGPNTIRLWESLGFGAIPVVLSDNWLPPGDSRLWEDAVVFCSETREDIQNLPKVMEKIQGDRHLLQRKRGAGRELWAKYGPDGFISDIQALYKQIAQKKHSYTPQNLNFPSNRPRQIKEMSVSAAANGASKISAPVELAPDSFAKANRFYRANEYAEALRIYEALHAREPLSIYRTNAEMAKAKLSAQ